MNNQIRQLPHVPAEPLKIEREFVHGREIIVIEGVRYDAEYFRTFGYPETDCLYAVTRREEDVVLKTIRNRAEAAVFFDETFGADPEFAWEQVKHYDPTAPLSPITVTFPQIEENDLGEENQTGTGDDDGL